MAEELFVCGSVFSGINCGDPGNVLNGRRNGFDFTCDRTITYTCDNCYRLQGQASLTCQPSGQWSTSTPTCISKNNHIPRVLWSILMKSDKSELNLS